MNKTKLKNKIISLILALCITVSLIPASVVSFAADVIRESGVTYVGTVGKGETLTFANGSGYKVYSDEECTIPMTSGIFPSGKALTVFLKPETSYGIWSVNMVNESTGFAVLPELTPLENGVKRLQIKAEDMTLNGKIKISIKTAVSAYGGIIESNTSAAAVAEMFDASYTADSDENIIVTDNVSVVKEGSQFTVTITSNILLDGYTHHHTQIKGDRTEQGWEDKAIFYQGIVVGSYVTLNILSSGDYTIKRDNPDFFKGNMFDGQIGSKIIFGSGTLSNNTVTYFYSNGQTYTKEIEGAVVEPTAAERLEAGIDEDAYIINAISNAHVAGTQNGTLTLDGGTSLEEMGAYTGTDFRLDRASEPSDDALTRGEAFTQGVKLRNDLSIVRSTDGEVHMWPGVIMQNNKSNNGNTGNTNGGGAVHINGYTGAFYMYGGIIKDMVNNMASHPGSDAGAIAVNGGSSKVYLYGGEITNCEAMHGGAIIFWGAPNSTLAIFDTHIHNNLSPADKPYDRAHPSATIATWASAGGGNAINYKIFGGVIANNQNKPVGKNPFGTEADICLYNGTVANMSIYSGTIGAVSCGLYSGNTNETHLYIYAASVGETIWSNPSWVHYPAENALHSVTIPNAVHGAGSVTVNATAVNEDGVTYANVTGTGTAGSEDLTIQLPNGTYTITVTSPSMVKVYKVTVSQADASATLVSRELTSTVLANKTSNSVTIYLAGTDNDATDGRMYYGFSSTSNTDDVVWYYVSEGRLYTDSGLYEGEYVSVNNENRTITFHYISGPRYYFVRVGEAGALQGQLTQGLLVQTVSVAGIEAAPLIYETGAGNTVLFEAWVTNTDGTEDTEVIWSYVGGVSASTNINEFGALHIGADEVERPRLNLMSAVNISAEKLEFSAPGDGSQSGDVYVVGAEGLPGGYYYFVDGDGNNQYFLTTSKLIEGDTLTIREDADGGKYVEQSVNRFYITATAANNDAFSQEMMLVLGNSASNEIPSILDIKVLLDSEEVDRMTSFTKAEGSETAYNFRSDAKVPGAVPGSSIFLDIKTIEGATSCTVEEIKFYKGEFSDGEFSSNAVFTDAEYDPTSGVTIKKEHSNQSGIAAYIKVTTQTAEARYLIIINFVVMDNSWQIPLTCKDSYLGGTPNPYAGAAYGDVVYYYKPKDAPDTAYTTSKPDDIGEWTVKAEVEETSFYTGLSATCDFVVSELPPPVVEWRFEGIGNLTLTYGESLNWLLDNPAMKAYATVTSTNTDGTVTTAPEVLVVGTFSWSASDGVKVPYVNESGAQYVLTFTPNNTEAYGRLTTAYVKVTVLRKTLTADSLPTVNYIGRDPATTSNLSSLPLTKPEADVLDNGTVINGKWIWESASTEIAKALGIAQGVLFIPDNENYNMIKVSIVPKISLTVTAKPQSVPYSTPLVLNQGLAYYGYTEYTPCAGDILNVTLAPSSDNQSVIPQCTVKNGDADVSFKYNITPAHGELTVTEGISELTFSELTYGAGYVEFTFTYKGDPRVDGVTVTVTEGEISSSPDGNYSSSITFDSVQSGDSVTVYVKPSGQTLKDAATVTVSVPKGNYAAIEKTINVRNSFTVVDYEGIYDGQPHLPSFSSTGDYTVKYYTDSTYSTETQGYKDVAQSGSYTVYYRVNGSTDADMNGSATITIIPKPLTVVWNTTDMTYNGSAQVPTVQIPTGIEGEEVSGRVSAKDGSETVNAGTYEYKVVLTSENKGNFTLTNDTETAQIKKATPIIYMGREPGEVYEPQYTGELVYWKPDAVINVDGADVQLQYTYYNVVGGNYHETASGDASGANTTGGAPKNIGEYAVRVIWTAPTDSNYESADSSHYNMNVVRRKITFTASDQFAVNSDASSPLTAENTAAITAGSLLSGHSFSVTATGSKWGYGVADKTITEHTLQDTSGADVSAYYDVDYQKGSLIVGEVFAKEDISHIKLTDGVGNELRPSANKGFTVRYRIPKEALEKMEFKFSSPLPVGTAVTAYHINGTGMGAQTTFGRFYRYIVESDGVTLITASNHNIAEAPAFVAMGEAMTSGNKFSVSGSSDVEIQIIVDFPDITEALPEFDMTMECSFEVKHSIKCTAAPSVSFGDAETDDSLLGSKLTLSNTSVGGDTLVIKIKDAAGNFIKLPNNASASLIKDGAEAAAALLRDDMAVFKGVQSGEYTVRVSGMLDATYTLVAFLCTDITEDDKLYPMANKVAQADSQQDKAEYKKDAVYATLTDGGRFIPQGQEQTLTFNVSEAGQGALEVYVQKKDGSTYTQLSEGVTISDNGGGTYKITVSPSVPVGTYRVVFAKGDAQFCFNVIVYK